MEKLLLITTFIFAEIFSIGAEARIVNRRVKEAPKACTEMKEDHFLSRDIKKVYGTLKSSVVILNDEVQVVDDLGKIMCQWPKSEFKQYADMTDFTFYIDEYKNALYPYIKNDAGYVILSADLNSCEITSYESEQLSLPKCQKPAGKKSKAKVKKSTSA